METTTILRNIITVHNVPLPVYSILAGYTDLYNKLLGARLTYYKILLYINMKFTLDVYLYEIQPHEGIMAHWCELGHAMLRLRFATNEMESGINKLRDLKTTYRLQYQIENFYVRIFELRERLFSFVSEIVKDDKAKEKLRHPSKRSKVVESLSLICKACVPPLERIIMLLDNDIEIRNIHTHSTFVRIGLHSKNHTFDIEDLWWKWEEDRDSMKKIHRNIRKEGRIMIKDYKVKVESICNEVDMFLKALIPHLRESGV